MYQVYAIRGGEWELTGCWGSEYAQYSTVEQAETACATLAETYDDVGWGYQDAEGYQATVIQEPEPVEPPHSDGCRCADCDGARGDYEYDRRRDEQLMQDSR